jgi:hypothetical protein
MIERQKQQTIYSIPTAKPQAPSHQGVLTYHKLFDEMTPQQGVLYLQELRDRMARKQQRERAYLDRRAARGTHTPTDDAYEEDQRLESEVISFLNELVERLAREV